MASLAAVTVSAAAGLWYAYRWWWSGEPAVTPPSRRLHQLEKHYQQLLHKHVGGKREVCCKYGFVDVLTEDAIYEVKVWTCYKDVLGQLSGYSLCFPGRRKVAVLFGRPYKDRVKKREVVQLLKQYGLEVWMYDSNDILFEM